MHHSLISLQMSPLAGVAEGFKESAAWGHVGTWKSGEHCGGPGTACRLSPGLGGKNTFFFFKLEKPLHLKTRLLRKQAIINFAHQFLHHREGALQT